MTEKELKQSFNKTNYDSVYQKNIKRIIDLLVGIIALPFFIIIFIPVAILIKLDDNGPIFYSSKRIGKNFKEFGMLKFRSMRVNAPNILNEDGSTYNSKDDPRVTKIGKFLRETSLDEIPQIINVLKGDMCLIGPRAGDVESKDTYDDDEKDKLLVKPGITGYTQAYYRNNLGVREKRLYDAWYAHNTSLKLDIKIFFKTILTVLKRENIYTNASIFGLTKKQIDEKLDDIIEFSELGEAVDNPVRTYSSGMYMRLAFSVAINVEADVLLIDEILAVGDVSFQKKCFEKLREIKYSGTTIVIVSHSLQQIEQICDKSIWIEKGHIRQIGNPKEIHLKYLKEMEEERQRLIHEAQKNKENDIEDRDSFCGKKVIRSGSGEVYFTNVTLKDKEEKLQNVYKSHDFMQVQYDFVNKSDIEEAVFSVRIYKDDNTHCYGTTSDIECNDTIKIKGKNKFIVDFDDLCLLDGNYMIDVDVKDKTGDIVYDSIHDTIRFDVINEDGRTGVCAIRTSWKVE